MTPTHLSRSILLSMLTAAVALGLACEQASPVGGGAGAAADGPASAAALAGAGGGEIETGEDVTWPGGSAIALDEDLVVSGALRIERGVTVTAAAGVAIVVADGGSLVADGRASAPILFTGAAPDRWAGIVVEPGGAADIDHAIVERTTDVAIRGASASIRVDDSVVRDVLASTPGGDARGLSFVGGNVVVTDSVVDGVLAGEGVAGDAGVAGTDGEAGAAGQQPQEGDPIPPVAGGPGADGAAGADGALGGEATGIYVGGDGVAVLAGNHVQQIQAGPGGDGGAGGSGGAGGVGGDGLGGQDGAAGGAAGLGGGGGAGGAGGAARGIWVDGAAMVEWLDNRVDGVLAGSGGSGGQAGAGGAGGAGGSGGDEVIEPGAEAAAAAGAAGADGGSGGQGGPGGSGGIARAVHVRASATSGLVQSELGDVVAGAGGAAGAGADGGTGGAGGAGGNALSEGAAGGAGASGGQGGNGGDGASGGAAGLAVAIEVSETTGADELVTASTVLALAAVDAGTGGAAGLGGVGGLGGADGSGVVQPQPRISEDGPAGADGTAGAAGEAGLAAGVWATAEAGVLVRNTIFQLASPAAGVGLVAEAGSAIDSDSNLFWEVAALSDGDVSSGGRDRILDPRLVDAANGDARLGASSPAIDAGDNAFLPAYVVADIGGEPRPVDDPGTDDSGSGDDRPVVDIGAHEFQPPSCDVDRHELWPPNHKFVTVNVDVDLGSLALADPSVSVFASSDEPDNDKGDGNTTGDVNGQDGYTSPVDVSEGCEDVAFDHTTCQVDLRAERAGPGDGRVYTIGVRVSGEDGWREAECTTTVPHDQRDHDDDDVEEPVCDPDDDDETGCSPEHEHGD